METSDGKMVAVLAGHECTVLPCYLTMTRDLRHEKCSAMIQQHQAAPNMKCGGDKLRFGRGTQ